MSMAAAGIDEKFMYGSRFRVGDVVTWVTRGGKKVRKVGRILAVVPVGSGPLCTMERFGYSQDTHQVQSGVAIVRVETFVVEVPNIRKPVKRKVLPCAYAVPGELLSDEVNGREPGTYPA